MTSSKHSGQAIPLFSRFGSCLSFWLVNRKCCCHFIQRLKTPFVWPLGSGVCQLSHSIISSVNSQSVLIIFCLTTTWPACAFNAKNSSSCSFIVITLKVRPQYKTIWYPISNLKFYITIRTSRNTTMLTHIGVFYLFCLVTPYIGKIIPYYSYNAISMHSVTLCKLNQRPARHHPAQMSNHCYILMISKNLQSYQNKLQFCYR